MIAPVESPCPPAWFHVPDHVATYGPEVADLYAAAGQEMDPEQILVLDAEYAVDETGRLVSTEVGCSSPRQNVKTHAGKASALADLVSFHVPQCLWTAHLRDTAYDAFRNPDGTGLADLFDNIDWLRRLVDDIKDSDGECSITLRPKAAGEPRAKLSFVTRSERGGRGLSGMRVTFDEALFLKPSMTSAMVPILSARSMAGQVQVRYLGSPGLASSKTWREVRDRGRTGTARALAWVEWAAPRVRCEQLDCTHAYGVAVGCALDREDLVRAANLAVDRRMDIRFVLDTERAAMTPEDFMRERLGWWDDPIAGGGVLDLDEWGRAAIGAQEDMTAPVIAVEIALDRSSATIGAVWSVAGKPHAEIVEDRPVAGAHDRILALAEKYQAQAVVLDADTEAAGLAPALVAAGLQVMLVTRADRIAACGGFYDAATTEALTHSGDPAMAEAIKNARWKDAGDGARAFSRRRSAGDICALYVVVLALWGLHELSRTDRPSAYEERGFVSL